ncbi:hypothetical protein BB559_001051 [Furculomyces boomerangus]|uniref:Prefoldin subunit 4 n=2 Tax=Harpellales TaxID=61421 RepID=A0A2T9Z374_9FUNG|nr:hypothetical protein BB559_001051 [Furculomyces boomerangus]PVZ98299.1 hypothetical protein BB558_005694 [Smittium angustum]PWA02447.1 hypothetical protein BB558_001425 [Smittium angustum]
MDYLDDLGLEIELLDEDSPVSYKIGDAFIKLPLSEAQERIEKEKELLETSLSKMKSKVLEISQELETLKTQLYAKFGKSINLDKD